MEMDGVFMAHPWEARPGWTSVALRRIIILGSSLGQR